MICSGQYCTDKKPCAVVPLRGSRQQCTGKSLFSVVLILLGLHCAGQNLMQCCPRGSGQHSIGKNPGNVVWATSGHSLVTPQFSQILAFTPKPKWQPPKGHPNLEVFCSQIEKELFELTETPLGYLNFSKEWQAMRLLANDRSIVIKKADKQSCVVVWDSEDYIVEAERQLGDKNIYKDIDLKKKSHKNLQKLVIVCLGILRKRVVSPKKEL